MPTATQVVLYILAAVAAVGVVAVLVWLVRKWLRGSASTSSATVTPAHSRPALPHRDRRRPHRRHAPGSVQHVGSSQEHPAQPLERGSLATLRDKGNVQAPVAPILLPGQPAVELSSDMLDTPTRSRAGAFDFGRRLKELFGQTTSQQRQTARKVLMNDARDEVMCASLMNSVGDGLSDGYAFLLSDNPSGARSMCKDMAQTVLDADA